MRVLSAAFAVIWSCALVDAQVLVSESGIRAHQVNGITTITLPGSPDHVTFYVWPQAKDVTFNFLFRPRLVCGRGWRNRFLYDYYNPDARTVLVPGEFTAR
jgi:hypothetical protein